ELVGRHLNHWDAYAALWHGVAQVFDRHPELRAVWSEFPTNSTIAVAFAHAERRSLPFFGYQAARVPGFFNIARDALGVEYVANPSPPPPTSTWTESPDYARLPSNTLASQRWFDLLAPVLRRARDLSFRPGEVSPEIGVPALWQAQTTL